MRKFLAIIGAILLAFGIAAGILYAQGKSITELFSHSDQQTVLLPELPEVEVPEVLPDLDLSYSEYVSRGDKLFESGSFTAAIAEYVQASEVEPDRLEPYLKLIETHYELRNYEEALANVDYVLEKDPSNSEIEFKRILVKIKLSDFNDAQSLLSQLSDLNDPTNLYYQGILLALFGDHDAAKSRLNAARSASDQADLNEKIARVLRAYETFELNDAAEDLYLDQLLARSFNENEEYEMAIYLLKEVLRTRSELRDGWVLFGFAYLNLENYKYAFTAFEKAYSLDTTWAPTQYFLGISHKELGDPEEAIVYFDAALNNGFEPQVVIQNHLADLYFETRDYEKAVEAYEAVLMVSRQDVNSFVRPVWLYNDYLNEPEAALRIAQSALEAFPDSAMSYNLVGWSHVNLRNFEAAELNLSRALEMDPELAAAHQNFGRMYELQNDFDSALESYKSAYELDRNGPIGSLAAKQYNELIKKTLTPSSDEESFEN